MKKIVKKKNIIILIIVFGMIWIAMGMIDYFRVSNFERPLFCTARESVYKGVEDYNHYQGLGYSFEVAENPSELELSGVTRYTYFLFGNEVVSGIRD